MNKKEPSNFFAKIFYKILLIIDPDDILTKDAQLAFDIFKTSLEDPNNMYLLNYELSGEKFIVPKSYFSETVDKHNRTCLILNSFDKKITIINHTYQCDIPFDIPFDVSLPSKTCRIMEKMFENKVIEERQKMKSEILKNTINSLELVFNNLKNNN